MARLARPLTALLFAPIAAASFLGAAVAAEDLGRQSSARHDFRLVSVAAGLDHPWAMAFLPDGAVLITERPGRLRIVRDGVLDPVPVAGVPDVVARGQGGLLDIALHPDYARTGWLYLSYAGPGRGGAGTEVARARLAGHALTDLEVIFRAAPKSGGGRHFGSRLAFDPAGHLYVTSGERGDGGRAQDLGDHGGKIIRLNDDGSVPADNPFVGSTTARPEIFAYGNRNPQGLATHPDTGAIWAHEHGPRGGDEVNIIGAGINYGWPLVTYGRAYTGGRIGDGTSRPDVQEPLTVWVPSIAPSGMAFYRGTAFPNWDGDLFVGALAGRLLVRLEVAGDRIVGEERLLTDFGERIRDVRLGPDGTLYLLTDSANGRLLRLEPLSG